ncbi:MAG: hypothetical protein A3H97_02875 [Acidobacteria bacterium RIFCSPLOWO2_02_FULL_65_29]|nr:MAG: hypothetical protein A3H97_02875 [Acidobacteria bacterium RIFCSPLOWO2_02_FULL_65_29]
MPAGRLARLGATPDFHHGPLAAGAASAADPKDPLARARLLYNQGQFEPAIAAAEEGRRVPALADAADLIAARAYLERFRETAAPDDLTAARVRLRRITPDRLGVRERAEYLVGLGETLFFDEAAGAAARVFESVLTGGAVLTPDARERILDWWASALDRDARNRSDDERPDVYRTIRDRMQAELGANATSATSSYWLSAAAWGQGDHQAAWDAAQAGWVRAPLAADRGAALRGDLDRLVLRAIIPERARALAQAPASLEIEWESFKERWSR